MYLARVVILLGTKIMTLAFIDPILVLLGKNSSAWLCDIKIYQYHIKMLY